MMVSKNSQCIFISLILSIVCFFLLSLYLDGDQKYYIRFYNEISDLSYLQALLHAPSIIGSNEPVSIFFLWLGSYLNIDKVFYISIFNFLLVYYSMVFFTRQNVHIIISLAIVSGFYYIVVMTGAERLKFGLLFFVIAMLNIKIFSNFIFFAFLSILAHYQMFILLVAFFLHNHTSFYYFKNVLVSLNKIFLFYFIVFLLLIFCYVILSSSIFYEFLHLIDYKISVYNFKSHMLIGFINFFILSFVIFISSSFRFTYVIPLLIFLFFSLLLGTERINIMLYLFSVFQLALDKRINNTVMIIPISYFVFKGFFFAYIIVYNGTGFV